ATGHQVTPTSILLPPTAAGGFPGHEETCWHSKTSLRKKGRRSNLPTSLPERNHFCYQKNPRLLPSEGRSNSLLRNVFEYARQDLNLQPLAPEANALSN